MATVRSAGARSRRAPVRGKNCSSSCLTKDHSSFGECMRSKNLHLSPSVNDDYSKRQHAWDSELNSYESAVSQGVQPDGTKQHQIDAAMRKAEENG